MVTVHRKKKPTLINLPAELVKLAHQLGVNISRTCEIALYQTIRTKKFDGSMPDGPAN